MPAAEKLDSQMQQRVQGAAWQEALADEHWCSEVLAAVCITAVQAETGLPARSSTTKAPSADWPCTRSDILRGACACAFCAPVAPCQSQAF